MRKRTLSREFALKVLYQHELRGELSVGELYALCETEGGGERDDFGRELAEGCLANRESLDRVIQETAENWRLDRMPIVDRNILRLATYELLFRHDTPPKVAINEAIELAKKFSTENSAAFVNGMLDRIYSLHSARQNQGAENGPAPRTERPGASELEFGDLVPDPRERADLHVHSSASDGSLEPEQVVRLASEAGLSAIALADHDTLEGLPAALSAGRKAGLRVIPGVELSAYARDAADAQKVEVHILGLFVDPNDSQLLSELHRLRQARVARIEKMGEKLRSLGLGFETEGVLKRAGRGSAGRAHFALEMVRQGICADTREAFERYIGKDGPAYVPKERLTPEQAIRLVHGAGGCSVLCHPGCSKDVQEAIPELREAGLDGIEVHSSSHSEQDRARWLEVVRRFGLAVSGGSDFHGEAKPEVEIGRETVSLVEVCELLARSRKRRLLSALRCEP